MTDFINEIDAVAKWLDFLPAWAPSLLLLLLASAVALLLHAAAVASFRKALPRHASYFRPLMGRIRGPSRLALLILAWSITLQSKVFDGVAANLLGKALLIAFIALVGWAVIAAINLGSDIYLRRAKAVGGADVLARKHFTQIRILRRTAVVVAVALTVAAALMTIDPVRQFGVSVLASAGVAGLVIGLAAQPVLSNLIAGVQLAVTQPIRIEDAVVVEGEWGWIEEITATYVVVRLWDLRRLVIPLRYFIEHPFENWTRDSGAIIGSVYLHLDYRAPVGELRRKLVELVEASPNWDGEVVKLQVTDSSANSVELRALASAATSGAAWDLRCELREKLIDFLQAEHPEALPRQRAEIAGTVEETRETHAGLAPSRS